MSSEEPLATTISEQSAGERLKFVTLTVMESVNSADYAILLSLKDSTVNATLFPDDSDEASNTSSELATASLKET